MKELPPRHESMRGYFAYELYTQMQENPRIWVVTGDLGYGMLDYIRRDFPDRFINTGAAEQAMMGISVGLALEGKIPFVYSITPFLLYRPFETIRNYINQEKIPVKLVGGGRDKDYKHDGFSHWAEEDGKIMNLFPNIETYWPQRNDYIQNIVKCMVKGSRPAYLNLRR